MDIIKEVFDNNRIPICFSANAGFLPYTAAMIQSIIDMSSSNNNYDIVILHTGLDKNLQKKVMCLSKNKSNISIRFYDISDYMKTVKLFTKSVYTGTTYTNEAYYRLLIPTLMPQYDKVLYFDGDMIAIADVAELYYSTDMTGYMLASSRDYAGISNCYIPGDPRREYREKILGLKNIDNYIISGMLVMNPSEFNKKYTGEQLLEICASREWRQHDQDVLNVVCEDSLKLISGSWDYLEDYGNTKYLPKWLYDEYMETSKNIKIIHYAGPRKPWKYNNSFMSDKFWDACFKTPFFKDIIQNMYKNYGYKNSILKHLYKKDPDISYSIGDAYLSNSGFFIGQMSDIYTQIDWFTFTNNVLTVDGFFNFMGITETEKVNIYLSIDGKLHECELTQRNCSEYKFDRLFYRGVSFKGIVKLDPTKKHTIKLVAKIRDNHYIVNKNLRFGTFCAINETKNKYYFVHNVIFKTNNQVITMTPAGKKARLKHELKYLKTIKNKKRKIKRICYFLYRLFAKKSIWLISDRPNVAGDNGEAFFKYITKNKPKNVKPYFVITKNSPDYKRLKKTGKIISFNSKKFRFYQMFADKIISSHLDNEMFFNYDKKVFSDIMMHQHIVFLQHGITKDDISNIYSKYNKNIDLFITSVNKEYESIINTPNYGCGNSNVKMTGFPRYDYLNDKKRKIISVLPTWRQSYLFLDKGKWVCKENFKDTAYYKFYYNLLTNKQLLKTLKKHHYSIEFIPHSLMYGFNSYFENLNNVTLKTQCSYSKIFEETSLLITDYSSTAFDVAYLNKPVIYCHFDKEEFFNSHTYTQGYFDYERDGLGDVVYDLEKTVNLIIDYINNDCKIKQKYQERINNFYSYRDNLNSQRVLIEILKLKNK